MLLNCHPDHVALRVRQEADGGRHASLPPPAHAVRAAKAGGRPQELAVHFRGSLGDLSGIFWGSLRGSAPARSGQAPGQGRQTPLGPQDRHPTPSEATARQGGPLLEITRR